MKKILFGLLALGTISTFAQTEQVLNQGKECEETVDCEIQADKEEALVVVGEEKTISVENSEVSVLHSNEQGEPLSYLIKRNDGRMTILGVVDKTGNQVSGIVNAYAGFQTFFGVNAGLTLFKAIDIGVHARKNSFGNEGILYPSVTKTGFHANIKFRPVKSLEVYAGMRWNNYSSTNRGYGNTNLKYNGKTTEYVGGVRYNLDGRQSVGVEVGYATGLLTKDESSRYYIPASLGENTSDIKKLKAPVINFTYRITLFNH
jgi:hypothetical protein